MVQMQAMRLLPRAAAREHAFWRIARVACVACHLESSLKARWSVAGFCRGAAARIAAAAVTTTPAASEATTKADVHLQQAERRAECAVPGILPE